METDTCVESVHRTYVVSTYNVLVSAGEIQTAFTFYENTNELAETSFCVESDESVAIHTEFVVSSLEALNFTGVLAEDRRETETGSSGNVETTAELRTVRSDEVGEVSTEAEVKTEGVAVEALAVHGVAVELTSDSPDVVEVVSELESSVPRHCLSVSENFAITYGIYVEIVETSLYAELPLGEVVTLFRIVCIGLLIEVLIAASSNSVVISSNGLLNRSFILGNDDYSVMALSKDSRNSAQAKR